jgi:hypothetical protein
MRAFITLAGIVLLALAAEAQIAIRPGQYEYTIDMKIGVPKDATKAVLDAAGFDQQQKRLDCVTPDQARQAKEDIAKFIVQEMQASDSCTLSDSKITGNTLTFTTSCNEDGLRMTMTTQMTFGVDAFSGLTQGKDNEGRITTMKMSAKRVGDCK